MFTASSKRPRSNFVPQKVVSFKAFEAKEKNRMQMVYPFLSPEQIKGKIKNRWNKLKDEEKQNYTIIKLEKTPQKTPGKKPSEDSHKRKRKSPSSSKSPRAKTAKLDVCSTPEYVNTKKLSDFRSWHPETYDNDFTESSQSNVSSLSSPVLKKNPTSTYQTTGNLGMKIRSPDYGKITMQGILKNSDSAKKSKNENTRVSFTSPTEINTYNLQAEDDDTDRIDHNNNSEFNDFDDSDDEDSFLIRREDTEFLALDDNKFHTDMEEMDAAGQKDVDTINTDDSGKGLEQVKDSKVAAGVELSRESSIGISPASSDMSESQNTRQTRRSLSLSRKREDCNGNFSKDEPTFKSPSLPSSSQRGKHGSKKKKHVQDGVSDSPDMAKVRDESRSTSQITPLISHSNVDPDDYSTPQMDEILQQFTLNQAIKAPQKHKHDKEHVSAKERAQAQFLGRHVNRSLLSPPKVGDGVQKDGKVTKAGNTKRPKATRKSKDVDKESGEESEESCRSVCVNNQEKSQDSGRKSRVKKNSSSIPESMDNITAGSATRVTRRSKRLSAANEDTEMDTQSDDSRHDLNSRNQTDKDVNNNNVGNDNLTLPDMNPSGDAGGYVKCSDQELFENEVDIGNPIGDGANLRNTQNKSLPARKRRFDNSRHSVDSPPCSSSSQDFSPVSPSDEHIENSPGNFNVKKMKAAIKRKIEMRLPINPVLERALKLLQLTTSSPNTWNDGEKDEMDSPGLLSPALSGVSELSSASSSTSRMSENAVHNLQSSDGNELCQLFTDLTPPDQKTTGQYKTQRMLYSNTDRNHDNMNEFVSDETDIFS